MSDEGGAGAFTAAACTKVKKQPSERCIEHGADWCGPAEKPQHRRKPRTQSVCKSANFTGDRRAAYTYPAPGSLQMQNAKSRPRVPWGVVQSRFGPEREGTPSSQGRGGAARSSRAARSTPRASALLQVPGAWCFCFCLLHKPMGSQAAAWAWA
jgi:hypothetical protein